LWYFSAIWDLRVIVTTELLTYLLTCLLTYLLTYLRSFSFPVISCHPNFSFCHIAQRYSSGLRAGGSVVRVPAGAGNFSLHHRVQTVSGAYPASYPMGTKGSLPGSKAATAHLRPVPRSRMRGAISPLPQYAFMAWR
jgi:hypothetical protein